MSPVTGAREESQVSEEVGILNNELSTSQDLSVSTSPVLSVCSGAIKAHSCSIPLQDPFYSVLV